MVCLVASLLKIHKETLSLIFDLSICLSEARTMQAFCLFFLATGALSEQAFLQATFKNVEQHVQTPLGHSVVGGMAELIAKEHPHQPVGEGADQSYEAVLQRTHSDNSNCEEGHWIECFKKSGDFVDQNHEAQAEKNVKSNARSIHDMGYGVVVLVTALNFRS